MKKQEYKILENLVLDNKIFGHKNKINLSENIINMIHRVGTNADTSGFSIMRRLLQNKKLSDIIKPNKK